MAFSAKTCSLHIKHICLFVLLSLSLSEEINAQIAPPDFLCIKNDSLIWEMPVNNCGPFIAYEVYFSTSPDGPFNLLATITDEATTEFVHPNLLGQARYYYLLSNYQCPGQQQIPSDTLSNLALDMGPISSVSVENDLAIVRWQISNSPQTIGYIIYRETPLGTIPVDTVFGQTSYIDSLSSPNQGPETYFVLALDQCGNTSLFNLPQNTLFLEASAEGCERAAKLNWRLYRNWEDGIQSHVILVSENGGAFEAVDTIGPNAVSYSFERIDDKTDYCFIVQAISGNLEDISLSNRACFTSDVVQAVKDFYITNVSFQGFDQVKIDWTWNENAELTSAFLLSGADTTSLSSALDVSPGPPPLFTNNSVLIEAGSAQIQNLFYRIETTDDCDLVDRSSYASSVFIQGFAQNKESNTLSWTSFDHPFANVEEYRLFRFREGFLPELIATLAPSDTSFIHFLDVTDQSNQSSCYFVRAIATLELPEQAPLEISSQSNLTCIDQIPEIFIPNAFTPRGRNPEFKPVFLFSESVTDYTMVIYSRWGEELFITNDINEAWRGRSMNGQEIPQGTYLYFISYSIPTGERIEKKGTVLLLR